MFIGQGRIWSELNILIRAMQSGTNLNLLLSAPSGWGKSRMAIIIGNDVSPDNVYYDVPDSNGTLDLQYIRDSRVVILDEIHTLRQPELLYPLLDRRDRNFILCTNESGVLREPLVNRCISFIFDDYTMSEIAAIARSSLIDAGIDFPVSFLQIIANNCNGNPRITKQITERLILIFRERGVPGTLQELENIIRNVLQIDNGLNIYHRRYIEFLRKVGISSLSRISFSLHIDPATIQREIEPVLISRNIITITSKGRKLL